LVIKTHERGRSAIFTIFVSSCCKIEFAVVKILEPQLSGCVSWILLWWTRPPDDESLRGFYGLDEFFFTTAEKKLLEDAFFRISSMTNSFKYSTR
jgi:hypothetical protein